MKWSWKSFGMRLATTFVAALAVAYIVGKIIDAKQEPAVADSTSVSMAIGGFIAPLFLAAFSGWKRWGLKMLLIITFVVSGLYSGNPAAPVVSFPLAIFVYFLAAKLHDLKSYYGAPQAPAPEKPASER